MPDVGLCAQVACIWEATARKAGNVHRYRDFADVAYTDFLLGAAALAPVLAEVSHRRVGATVLEGVRATRRVVASNTNLGIVLLLAPLATVPDGEDPRTALPPLLDRLDVEDARLVYEAIRLAAPGGLGEAPEQDVRSEPTLPLRKIMALAADRDLIARQYANGFREVFEQGVPALRLGLEATGSLEGAIIYSQLRLLSEFPDTLIARKRGAAEAEEAALRARWVLSQQWPHKEAGWSVFAEFDVWLRAEGNGRNPGATADLLAASLFVLFREGTFPLPPAYPWAASGFDHVSGAIGEIGVSSSLRPN
jgi:triphosphoribosyl-dephospho-CoA synthase